MSTAYDDRLAALQGAGRLPSVVAGVARGGEPVWRGSACVDPSTPAIGAGTAYRIGSITKTLTAVLVLQLRDEGLLSLTDQVGRFVPETGYADATLRDLLAHTAGLQSEPVGPWWERSPGVAAEHLLAANDGSGRVAPAGECFHYSNLGFALLGEVVSRLRGASWWEVVRGRLLAPLGMTATTYLPPEDHAPGRSVDHFAHTLTVEPLTDTGAMAPAGQLWSTVDDLLRWADFLATGHPAVLAPATLAEMAVPTPQAGDYGLGLRVLALGGRALVGHTGSMPGFEASLFVDRETRDAAVVMANATTGLDTDLAAGVLLGLVSPPEAARWEPSSRPVPPAVAEVLGVWFWGNSADAFEWVGGEVVLRDLRSGEISDRFRPVGDAFLGTEGYHRGETLRVHRGEDGRPAYLECATFIWTRAPYDPGAPIPGGVPSP